MAGSKNASRRTSAIHGDRLDASRALADGLQAEGVGERVLRCGRVPGTGWVVVARQSGDVTAVEAAVSRLRLRDPGQVLVDADPISLLLAVLQPLYRCGGEIIDGVARINLYRSDKLRVISANGALLFLARSAAGVSRIDLDTAEDVRNTRL